MHSRCVWAASLGRLELVLLSLGTLSVRMSTESRLGFLPFYLLVRSYLAEIQMVSGKDKICKYKCAQVMMNILIKLQEWNEMTKKLDGS